LDSLLPLIVLLALSALFSSSETAFFSLKPWEVARLRAGGAAGRGAAALADRPNDLLAALLIGNVLVNTSAGVLTTAACLSLFGSGGLAVAVPAATVLILIFGEITPKLLALGARQQLVLLVQGPLRVWVAVTSPAVRLLTTALESALRLIPADRTGGRPLATEELQTACDLAVEDATLTLTEGRSLARLLALQDLEVREIMVPRPEVRTLDRAWDRQQILETVRRAGFNRLPVVAADSTHPIGLFHVKDLLRQSGASYPLAGPLRPLPVVPESKDVASLLAQMRTGAGHMAAVVDEHGDFAGIVTLADCLQALIGRVGDVARRRPLVVPLGGERWVIGGRLDLRALSEATGVELPAARDYVTVAGFVMARLGRIPAPGDRVEVSGATIEVLVVQGMRVDALQVTRHLSPSGQAGGA
jgi:putative hemolysin